MIKCIVVYICMFRHAKVERFAYTEHLENTFGQVYKARDPPQNRAVEINVYEDVILYNRFFFCLSCLLLCVLIADVIVRHRLLSRASVSGWQLILAEVNVWPLCVIYFLLLVMFP